MSELEKIKERLSDHRETAKVIQRVFYSSFIDGAAMNLAAALERHALGLPLIPVEQELREYLSTLTPEERAQWWRDKNASEIAKENPHA